MASGEYTLNLDWYHLRSTAKRCLPRLFRRQGQSGAVTTGSRKSSSVISGSEKFKRLKDYLDRIDPATVKSQKQLEAIKAYLDRKSPYVYCFALRKQLGLINSSNQGEKSNDLVVARPEA